jgi:hypothetical protein
MRASQGGNLVKLSGSIPRFPSLLLKHVDWLLTFVGGNCVTAVEIE